MNQPQVVVHLDVDVRALLVSGVIAAAAFIGVRALIRRVRS